MSESTTLTVRLPSRTKDRLAELAGRTRRTSSFLAAEAIADYVARELAVVEAIERGRDDVRAGRVTSHDEVAREARALIEAGRVRRPPSGSPESPGTFRGAPTSRDAGR